MKEVHTAGATLGGEVVERLLGEERTSIKVVEKGLCLCSSKFYTEDVLRGFLRRVILYSCSSGIFAVSTKAMFSLWF